MTRQEKIKAAEERIKELETLIKHLKKQNLFFTLKQHFLCEFCLSHYYSFFCIKTNGYRFANVLKRLLSSTMDSYTKDTHRYMFELVKAASMPLHKAEELDHIKQSDLGVS